MTNAEWIRSMDDVDLQDFLCEMLECKDCFADEYCYLGHNGIKEWLTMEREEDQRYIK